MIQPSPSSGNLVGGLEPTQGRTGAQFNVHAAWSPFVYRFSPTVSGMVTLDGKIGDVVLKGDFWLPLPSRITLAPGAANVEQKKDHQEETAMYASIRIEGTRDNAEVWIDAVVEDGDVNAPGYVSADFLPPGVPAGSYRRMARVKIPGRDEVYAHYITPWDGYRVVVPRSPAAHSFDKGRYNLWLASLVLRGIVPPVDPSFAQQHIARARSHIARAQGLPYADDVRKLRVGEKEANVKRAQAAKVLGV